MKKYFVIFLLTFSTHLLGAHFPSSLQEVEHLSIQLGGSTGATLVTYDNQLFVLKRGTTKGHIENEFHTNKLYQSLGVPVPETQLYEEGEEPAILTEFIEGVELKKFQKMMPAKHTKTVYGNIQRSFVVDCLLANWDVVGLDYDNIIIDYEGTPWRIDNGSGMRYRAGGDYKGDSWNGEVKEIITMRDPTINKKTARVFCSISDQEIRDQIEQVLLHSKDILKIVPEEDHDILEQRLEYLQKLIYTCKTPV